MPPMTYCEQRALGPLSNGLTTGFSSVSPSQPLLISTRLEPSYIPKLFKMALVIMMVAGGGTMPVIFLMVVLLSAMRTCPSQLKTYQQPHPDQPMRLILHMAWMTSIEL